MDQRERRPFGDRSSDEPQAPFGSRPGKQRSAPEPDGPQATDPYTDLEIEERPELPELVEAPSPIDEVADAIAEPEPQPVPDPQPEPAPEPELETVGGPIQLKVGVILRAMGSMMLSGVLVATLFTWWTPSGFLSEASREQLSVAQATQVSFDVTPAALATLDSAAANVQLPTATIAPPPPNLNRIGIVSGHRGIYPPTGLADPGAVCDDGLTEAEINEEVATRVVTALRAEGYDVDLLDEFDDRLENYRAAAMVSIHADSCADYGPGASGYKVASFERSAHPEEDSRLVNCLSVKYEEATGLGFHPSITYDMTLYHNFREIDPQTPGAIIEIGFMNLDRALLTQQPERVAQGIIDGVLCYMRGEVLPTPIIEEEP